MLNKGSCQKEADSLRGGQRKSSELDLRVHPLGHAKHIMEQAGHLQSIADLIQPNVCMTQAQVVDDAAGHNLVGSDELNTLAQ